MFATVLRRFESRLGDEVGAVYEAVKKSSGRAIAPPGQEGWLRQQEKRRDSLLRAAGGVVVQVQKNSVDSIHHPVRSIKGSFAIFFLVSRPPLLPRRGDGSPYDFFTASMTARDARLKRLCAVIDLISAAAARS